VQSPGFSGNSGLRGFDLKETEKNLSQAIELAQKNNVKVLLAGMKIPPNYGQAYTRQFEELFQKIADKYKVPLMPFLLEGVGGVSEHNLADGIHPNEKGHQVMAQNILEFLNRHISFSSMSDSTRSEKK
jgi:acyl-CoA thioesterase I